MGLNFIENDNGQVIKSMINWYIEINEIGHINHLYRDHTSVIRPHIMWQGSSVG